MQIDLFKSRRRCQDMAKVGGYVRTRKFELDKDVNFDNIRRMTNCENKQVIDSYIEDVKRRIAQGRQYDDIGYDLGSDNLFDIEALGVGKYAKRYQIIISFEDKLDYFLHAVSGCNPEAVRSIPHYAEVSAALTSLKEQQYQEDVKFSLLYGIDDNLDRYFMTMERGLRSKDKYFGDKFVEILARDIEISILREIAGIQNYIISCFSASRSEFSDVVCRSRSYSSLVFTSGRPINEQLILSMDGRENLMVTPRCYERYEYAVKEVLVCDTCRRC